MANLVVLGFDDRATADRVFTLITDELPAQKLLQLGDAALVWRDGDGKPKIQQAVNTTRTGATSGALWGTFIGLLFLAPVFGLVIGAATGAITGKLRDIGVDDNMIKELGAQLKPGTAAVFALVEGGTTDKVIDALKPYQPRVLQTSLTYDAQDELVKALQS